MKKLLCIAWALLPFLAVAQNKTCTVKLDIDTVTARIAYLVYKIGEETFTDSPLIKNGKATFEASVPYPVMAQLSLDNKGYGYANNQHPDLLRFYLEPGVIHIKTSGRVQEASIKGSPMNKDLLQYYAYIQAPMDTMENCNYELVTATPEQRKDTAFANIRFRTMNKAFANMKELQKDWIKAHPDAYCSLLALSTIAGSHLDVATVQPLYESLSPAVKNSVDGKAMAKRIEVAGMIGIGSMAPVFTQNDVNDQPVSLSDFRGKYVLLDFWASWCGPCRAENPNYVKAYNTYKDKNFTLLGVSLDRPGKKADWLAAIEKDGLTWTQVSDLQYWNNKVARMYDIMAVPANFLIDPTGKIIAKDLRGELLQQKLAELLGPAQP